MVRVIVYSDATDRNADGMRERVNQIHGQVRSVSNTLPRMYYLGPDGSVVSYIDYEEKQDAGPEGEKVSQISQWVSGVDRTIDRADRMAQRGRYAEAMREIEEIDDQDRQVSHLVQVMLGHADEADDAPESPVRPVFEGLREQKLAEYEALAQAELDAARELVAAEDYRGAQRALRGLIRGPESFATTAEAKALYDQVVELMRS